MNNEPVAWAMFVDGDFWDAIHPDEHDRIEGKYTIPLYTHPTKTQADIEYEADKAYWRTRTLTDEEIYALWEEFNGEIKNFARAILRKAQEK